MSRIQRGISPKLKMNFDQKYSILAHDENWQDQQSENSVSEW